MTAEYREPPLPCPGCGGSLEPRTVNDAVVDRCPDCGGLWADWFDGPLPQLVSSDEGRGRGATGAGPDACPRCRRPLAREALPAISPASHLARCPECAGVFVPRDAFEALLALPEPAEPPPAEPPSALARLLRVLRQLIGS